MVVHFFCTVKDFFPWGGEKGGHVTYRCLCCGAEFAAPLAHHPWRLRRISPEYGDAALLCCPECGQEAFEETEATPYGLV